ncbi:MAG: cell wall hydrolase [Lachnospiraceae bacterium]|nr:cell wall hydrolase [Lachnospiraceae bacterium]
MRKLFQNKLCLILSICLLACSVPVISYATSTQDRLNEAIKEKNEMKDKQDDIEDEIDDLKSEKKSLTKELKKMEAQLEEISANLSSLEEQIRVKEGEIEETLLALAEARATEEFQYECLKLRIQQMYEQGDMDYLNALLSASFTDVLNFTEYLNAMTEYDQRLLHEYEEIRIYIEGEEERLTLEKEELDGLKQAAEEEKQKVSDIITEMNKSIADYADQIEEAEKEAKAYEDAIKQKNKDIKALKKQIEEELALSAAAANMTWRDISSIQFAEGDRYLLANLIYCEAGGEPYVGQVAVGAVVINRVLCPRYPDTVVGVIYQKSQFSPAGSGRLALALAVNKATTKCYKAADEAMSGITNVGNCLYFRTPIPALEGKGIRIGGHVFY